MSNNNNETPNPGGPLPNKYLIPIKEAATFLGWTVRTLERKEKGKELTITRITRRRYLTIDELKRLLSGGMGGEA